MRDDAANDLRPDEAQPLDEEDLDGVTGGCVNGPQAPNTNLTGLTKYE